MYEYVLVDIKTVFEKLNIYSQKLNIKKQPIVLVPLMCVKSSFSLKSKLMLYPVLILF